MLTIHYLYYNQPNAITFLESIGAPDYAINFLFVDDGSKIPLKLNWPNAYVLRIDKDIPWNMSAANNVGFNYLYSQDPETIILRLDMDHFIYPRQINQILNIIPHIKTKMMMKFNRMNGIHSAPNIYMARIKDLVEAGGYDERFCGHYGYEDIEFLTRLKNKGFSFGLSTVEIQINMNEGTKGLDRDTSRNKKLLDEIKRTY